MLAKHAIKGWPKTQSLVALSSGEFEFYATLNAAAEGLGITAMLSDLGVHVRGEIWGDANAVLGIINRKGVGKTRHVDIGHVWIQDIAAKVRLKVSKILGKDNPADLYTEYLDEKTNNHHTNTVAYQFRDGRAQEAPKLHLLSRSRDEWEHGESFIECKEVGCVLSAIKIAGNRKAIQHGQKLSQTQWEQPQDFIQSTYADKFSQQINVFNVEMRRLNRELGHGETN